MDNYIDAFTLPVPRKSLDEYRRVAELVADIWKEHGALAYNEYVGEDLKSEGTRVFPDCVAASADEVGIFGWVVFDSRETRDLANKLVASDPRMQDLVGPLTRPQHLIFDASRMVYGGFQSLVQKISGAR